MSFDIDQLSNLDLDILKEIGNIGAGNAATALSTMLNKTIDMNVPEVKVIDLKEGSFFKDAETTVAGVYVEFYGDIKGTILFIIEEDTLGKMLSMLLPQPTELEIDKLSDVEVSALSEVVNILAGSYLMALNTFTGLRAYHTVPNLAVDMAAAILSVPIIEFSLYGDKAVFIESNLTDGTDNINNYFIFIPSVNSFPVLLQALLEVIK
jgi:chemotaxis protein CheC